MGSPKVSIPAAPTAPSIGSSIQDYVENYPKLQELQMASYAPDLLAQRSAQAQVYPEYEQMRKDLMGQVQTGISEEAPSWYMNKASDYIKSLLGENVRSGVGADFYTTGMLEQQKNWNDYYRNLALSFTGSTPVYQTSPTITSNFTPSSVMGMNSNIYGTQANIFGQQSQNAWNQANYTPPWMNMLGTLGGAALGQIGNAGSLGMMKYAGIF